MTDSVAQIEEISYAQAIDELERILGEIEEAHVDVDTLSTKVERAAFLLKLCRNRLVKAETQVKNVLAEMEEETCPPAESLED